MAFEELCSALNTLAVSDLSAHSADDLVSQIGPLTKGIQLTVPRFAPGVMLFRGRLGRVCGCVGDLSYPPASIVGLGRANRERSPVFYATTFRTVVFFEVPNQAGDHILVSRWRTVDHLLVNHLGYTTTVFDELRSRRTQPSWNGEKDPLQGHNPSRKALEMLGKLFASTDPNLYKLTAALAEFFMRPPLNGLIYPTIAMSANADNFALKPEWVDTGLEFIGVEVVRVDNVRGMERDVTVVDYATARSDGTLDWKGRGPNWQLTEEGQQLTLKAEQGVWIARGADGTIVGPS